MIRRYSQHKKNQQENGESPLFSMLCDPKSPCASAVVARVISLSYMFYTLVVKRCLPRIARLAVSCSLVLVAACAANRGGGAESEYVEVPNPGVTMYPNAPATIWVPRKSVESGIPRGRAVEAGLCKSYRGLENSPQGEKPVAAVPYAVSATMPLPSLFPRRNLQLRSRFRKAVLPYWKAATTDCSRRSAPELEAHR